MRTMDKDNKLNHSFINQIYFFIHLFIHLGEGVYYYYYVYGWLPAH